MITRRTVLSSGVLGLLGAALAGCASSSSTSSTPSATAPAAADGSGDGSGGGPGGGGAATTTTDAQALADEVASAFAQSEYVDAETGRTLPFNVFLPEGYADSGSHPLVLYIADSSLVGQDVTAPLTQYGALIWASAAEQAQRPAIVVVPEYPEVIIDDHGAYTTTDDFALTPRFVAWLQREYAVDPARVYGTGQSMGCMTVMALAAADPSLFTAELLVSGQWDPAQLTGLSEATFWSFAAGGDANASSGQADVKAILDDAGVAFAEAEWDATWSAEKTAAAATALLAEGARDQFVTFATGTVLTANPEAGSMEHMASFEPAYRVAAAREWLFAQTR